MDDRLMTMVADLSERPDSTVPLFSGNWAKTKAAYQFWDNSKATPRGILQSHIERTARRTMEYDVVLVAQDTTEINLTSHRKTSGMGYLASSKCRGFLVHSLLAISPTGGPPGDPGATALDAAHRWVGEGRSATRQIDRRKRKRTLAGRPGDGGTNSGGSPAGSRDCRSRGGYL